MNSCDKVRPWLSHWGLGAFYNHRGDPETQPPPMQLQQGPKAPKSLDLPHGSFAPGAVSRLSLGRFGPEFELPAGWGHLEVFLPLTPPTSAPHLGPIIHLAPSFICRPVSCCLTPIEVLPLLFIRHIHTLSCVEVRCQ